MYGLHLTSVRAKHWISGWEESSTAQCSIGNVVSGDGKLSNRSLADARRGQSGEPSNRKESLLETGQQRWGGLATLRADTLGICIWGRGNLKPG